MSQKLTLPVAAGMGAAATLAAGLLWLLRPADALPTVKSRMRRKAMRLVGHRGASVNGRTALSNPVYM